MTENRFNGLALIYAQSEIVKKKKKKKLSHEKIIDRFGKKNKRRLCLML